MTQGSAGDQGRPLLHEDILCRNLGQPLVSFLPSADWRKITDQNWNHARPEQLVGAVFPYALTIVREGCFITQTHIVARLCNLAGRTTQVPDYVNARIAGEPATDVVDNTEWEFVDKNKLTLSAIAGGDARRGSDQKMVRQLAQSLMAAGARAVRCFQIY